jgi:hypothetical protein
MVWSVYATRVPSGERARDWMEGRERVSFSVHGAFAPVVSCVSAARTTGALKRKNSIRIPATREFLPVK